MRILAGDIGGTHTRLALVDSSDDHRIADEAEYSSPEHDDLASLVHRFVDERDAAFEAACFGVAGPVHEGHVRATNLPWVVDERSLGEDLGVPVAVINDLEAAAWSVAILAPDAVETVHPGAGGDARGNRALIAAGTGLGEAGLFWDGSEHRPFATEGGHADFAPGDELERDLLAYLAREHDHVSWERVASGPGLEAIHRFLCVRRGGAGAGCPVAELAPGDEAAPAISRAALAGSCEVCTDSLDRFCRLLGAEAGNLALKVLATGGVWVGGGIAPEIREVLAAPGGAFMERFLAKGRMRDLLEPVPVRVILDDKAALRGAARVAARYKEERR